jgi:hypothetical protein
MGVKMDALVKKNIIKKNKVIIDIGHKYIKLLGVTYANNIITITGSYKIDAAPFFFENELTNYRELVKSINDIISRKKLIRNGEISLSLPTGMVEHRIGSAKNIKLSDLNKNVKSNIGLNKVSELTHNIDWSYLGQGEKNSDTHSYYLVSAINKSIINPLIKEFELKNLRVTTVSFTQNNIISFSDSYCNDFENINKLYLDFGINDTRVIVESGGTSIYSRTIDIGFNTFVDKLFASFGNVSIPELVELVINVGLKRDKYPLGIFDETKYFDIMDKVALQWQNELIRVIRLCENEGVEISKIICVNDSIIGLMDNFIENDIEVELFCSESISELSGSGYTTLLDSSEDYKIFGGAIGLAMATMQNDKRLNLLSTEQKEKHINKYLMYGFGGIVAVLALIMLFTYMNFGITNLKLNKLQKEDTQYKQKLSQITSAEDTIKKNSEFIGIYDNIHFPFYSLMQALEYKKPSGLTIISVDSMDRLVELPKEGGTDSKENKATETPKTNKKSETTETVKTEEKPLSVKFLKDLAGEKLSIRGYSTNPADISQFIYDLSTLEFITDLELKAIEEKIVNGTEHINVFEAIITVGGVEN